MKNLNNYTQDEIDSLIYLLNQEFSVLSRIDLNSDLGINITYKFPLSISFRKIFTLI